MGLSTARYKLISIFKFHFMRKKSFNFVNNVLIVNMQTGKTRGGRGMESNFMRHLYYNQLSSMLKLFTAIPLYESSLFKYLSYM